MIHRSRDKTNDTANAPTLRQRLQRHSLLINFLLPYLALLAIPILVMSVFLFHNVRGVVESRTLEYSLSNLRSAQQQIDQVIEDLMNLHTSISDYADTSVDDTYDRYDAQRKLKLLLETNGRLEAIYEYWFEEQYVISTEGVYDLSKPYVRLGNSAIPVSWFKECADAQDSFNVQRYDDDLFFVYPSIDYEHFSRRAIVFRIKCSVFLDMLGGKMGDVTPAIYGTDGQLIAGRVDDKLSEATALPDMADSTGTLLSADGKEIIAYAQSELTGWMLVHIHDREVTMRDLMDIELTGVALMLAIAVLGCFVILPAIRATYRPIASMTRQVEQTGAGMVTNFNALAQQLGHIYTTNHELRSFSETCTNLVKTQLFTSIERGQMLDTGEFWDMARVITGGEICASFALVLVRVHMHEREASDEMAFAGLADVMKQYLFPEGNIVSRWSTEGDDMVFAVLLNGQLHSAGELRAQSAKLLDDISEDGKTAYFVLIAADIDNIELVRQSYFAGMEALLKRDSAPITVLDGNHRLSDDMIKAGQRAVANMEASLLAHRTDEARAQLRDIVQHMPAYCSTSAYWAKYIGYDIMSTVVRNAGASDKMPTESMMLNIESGRWQEFMRELDEYMARAKAQPTESDGASAIVRQICEYIDAHISDSTLSIQDIAESIGYSYKYTSYVFRQQTGSRLSEYISRRRVDEFKALIKTSQQPISELIKRVGVENPATFHRLFKQLEGMTPGQYRQHMRQNRAENSDSETKEA